MAQRGATDRDWLDRAFADSGVPSLSMVVAQDGRLIWEQSWGFADVEGRVPATPQTMYSLASISKAITATGLMLLVERGQVDLDKPIEDYLGGLTLRAHVGDETSDCPASREPYGRPGLLKYARIASVAMS